MSYQLGLKGLLAGLRKNPEKDAGQSTSKKTKHATTSSKSEKSSGTGTSGDLTTNDDKAMPDRTLKRKQTVIFNPTDSKRKGVATDSMSKEVAMDSKGKGAAKDAPASAPASPSYSIGSSVYSSSSGSTITESKANRPGVHYFRCKSKALHGDPKTGKEIHEIIIVGFNDDATEEDLIVNDPGPSYKVPRLYIGSKEELRENSGITARMASGYVEQIIRGVPTAITRGFGSQLGERLRQTMGRMNTKDGEEFFILGANDLIVIETFYPVYWRDSGVPWAMDGQNVYPFAHDGHFERTHLKHFAWEWIKDSGNIEAVTRPLPATDGVHIWLIDYELRRRTKYREKTAAQGYRHIFYGRGARFVEVQKRDKEWHDNREPRELSALKQVKLWKESMELDEICGQTYLHYKWPTVGVLACEIGDF